MLPFLILLPFSAAILLAVLRFSDKSLVRWVSLLASVATLLLSLVLVDQYRALPAAKSAGPVKPRLEWQHAWLTYQIPPADSPEMREVSCEFYLGVDGISVLLIVLTALLTVSCVLVSWSSISERVTEFHACLLVLEAGLIGVFCAFDLLLFYVFFEFTLIPLFLLIGIWGGTRRRYAAGKFFIYTLAGSVVTLVGVVAFVLHLSTVANLGRPFSIPVVAFALSQDPLPVSLQWGLFLAVSAGFMIKVPLFPFHTWLPLAHVEAPTAGSVLLAGVLLKLGSYGFLRICLPFFPNACVSVGVPLVAVLSLIGIIYGALCALSQTDIKKLVAYSSVSHLGFCMLGMFALNPEGITGSVMQMINHGLSTGALFLIVGMLYERYHTRELRDLGGLMARVPLLGWTMVFVCLSSMGLPGLNGFVGEFLALIGMFKAHPVYAAIGASGVVLGAWYLLRMLEIGFFGPLREPAGSGDQHHPIRDMNLRELLALAPILVLCVAIGVYPKPILKMIEPDVQGVAKLYERSPTSWDQATAGTESEVEFSKVAMRGVHSVEEPASKQNRTPSIAVQVEPAMRQATVEVGQ